MILWGQDMPIFQRLIKDLFPGAVSGAEDLKMRCLNLFGLPRQRTRWTRQIVLICLMFRVIFWRFEWSFNMFQHVETTPDLTIWVIVGSQQAGAPG